VAVEPRDVLVEQVLEGVVVVDRPQDRSDVVHERRPADSPDPVEVADERRQVVDRGADVLALAGGPASHRVEPVREGRAGDGAVPAVADAELLAQVVVDGQVPRAVVTHHVARVDFRGAATLVHVGLDEAAVGVVELFVDRGSVVRRILRLGHARVLQLVHSEAEPVVVRELAAAVVIDVRHPGLEAVELGPSPGQRQVAEHVVVGAVLQHQHDDVLDLVERPHRVIDLYRYAFARARRGAHAHPLSLG